ncbi:siderophore-interacting protein [Ilumatobacter sp.]|uniref:siderophore-interacting protein n=1 Tax=Ilumatobacter sp. TaxID=1967498 RepID=UPI003C46177D
MSDRLSTFVTSVSEVTDLTPTLRQISFGGGLKEFVPVGGDQFLYVLLPPPGRSELTVDSTFSWERYGQMSDSERPVGAYYSVRRCARDRIDMWFVLHGDGGHAAEWAARARIGDVAALWGPRRAFHPPPTTCSYLFVTDETGYGAVAAVLDELLAADARVVVDVIAETHGDSCGAEFPTGVGVDVRWVSRAGRPPGTTTLLLDAVRDLDIADDAYAFGAGESRHMMAVRAHLCRRVGLCDTQVSMTGYWRMK